MLKRTFDRAAFGYNGKEDRIVKPHLEEQDISIFIEYDDSLSENMNAVFDILKVKEKDLVDSRQYVNQIAPYDGYTRIDGGVELLQIFFLEKIKFFDGIIKVYNDLQCEVESAIKKMESWIYEGPSGHVFPKDINVLYLLLQDSRNLRNLAEDISFPLPPSDYPKYSRENGIENSVSDDERLQELFSLII